MTLTQQIMEQITKHEEAVVRQAGYIKELEINMMVAEMNDLGDEFQSKFDCRFGECNAYKDHSGFMIRLFTVYLSNETSKIKKLKFKIIYRLIRDNVVVLQEHLAECVKYDYYTEGWYLDQMNKFKNEVNSWERLANAL